MSDLLIRNVSDRVRERLKREADRRGRSVQSEASQILEDWAATREREDQEWWDKVDEFRRQVGRIDFDSVQTIREDRDTDHGRDDSGFKT